jgi:hypothetical protein
MQNEKIFREAASRLRMPRRRSLRRSGRSPAMLIRAQRSGQEFRSTKTISLTKETRDSSQGV